MNELELEEMNRGVIADFRANGGEVGGQHALLDILLLHHLRNGLFSSRGACHGRHGHRTQPSSPRLGMEAWFKLPA